MFIFLYGPTTYSSRKKLNEIKADFIKNTDPSGINLGIFDGEKTTVSDLRKELFAAPFLAPRRLIIIKNALSSRNKNKNAETENEVIASPLKAGVTGSKLSPKNESSIENTIIEFVTEKNENILVLVEDDVKTKISKFETLKKQADECYEFPALKPEDVTKFILEEAKEIKAKITPLSASFLSGLIGSDLWRAHNELEKLASFANGEPITSEMISRLVSTDADSNIFPLIDAIAGKNKAQAISLLENELASEAHPLAILSMITRQFRIIIQIKDLLAQEGQISSDVIAQKLDLHPFVAKKSLPQASQFEMNYLKKIYRYLLSLDKAFKNSMGDPKLLLETLIAKI